MVTRSRARSACVLLSLVVTLTAAAIGVASADAPPDAHEQATKAAWEAARNALVRGPATIPLKDQANLKLPEQYGYVPQKQAAELMRVWGNTPDERLLGLVFPTGDENAEWFVSLEFEQSGYVKDDDAKHWNADELLQNLKDGTEAGNEQRTKMGVPAMTVTRWIEPPAYDPQTHRLVWSVEARRKDGQAEDPTVNYNTYVLGREGYVSLDLVTSVSTVEHDKAAVRTLLGLVSYNSGKDYGDFSSSTDKVAAYGLAALVAGVAAKKLGLLALIAATVVKFAKVILIAVAGIGAAIVKWFKSRTGRPGEPTA